MDGRTVATAALVLVFVLGGAQLAFTDVGESQGTSFTPAVTLASMPAGPDAKITDLAAAGDGEGGATAWIVTQDGEWSVRMARLTVADGKVTAEDTTTVVETDQRLESVSIDVRGERVAVAFERAGANNVAVHVLPSGEQYVVGQSALRVVETGVTLTPQGPVVGYQEYLNGTYRVAVTGVTPGSQRVLVGGRTTGNGVPAVTSSGDRVAVTWYDAENRSAILSALTLEDGSLAVDSHTRLGAARIAGSFGGQGVITMATDGGPGGVRSVWTDVGEVRTVGWKPDGTETGGADLGPGERPAVATADGTWLAAWLVQTRSSGLDVRFARAAGANTTTGIASQFQTDATHPSPVFAPDAGIVWTERGDESRVLASGFRQESTTGALTRLRLMPQRFAFVGLAGAIVAVVVTPLMPWTFVSFFVAFYATSATARNRFERTVARSGNGDSHSADLARIRGRIDRVPQWVWVGLFALVDSALLYLILPAGVSATAIEFSHPIGVSVLAALGTAVLLVERTWESTWGPLIIFAYLQTAALWITGLPTIL